MSDAALPVIPSNSALLETGLDLAFAKLLGRIEPPFPQLMDPMQTPVDFLSYLAADRGVLGWDSRASEASKRAAVQASWSTKRLAGTEKGLALALETTGFVPSFVPWYEVGAAPYTLLIIATSDANQTAEDYQNLGYRLEEAKAERDQVVIKVEKRLSVQQRLYIAQFARQSTRHEVFPDPIRVDLPDSPLRFGMALHSARVMTLRTNSAPVVAAANLFYGGVMRTATIIRIEATNG